MGDAVMSAVVISLVLGAVLLAVGMPGDRAARTILGRWAPRLEQSPDRVAIVRRHLVRRRVPFAVLLLLVWWAPLVYSLLLGPGEEGSATRRVMSVYSETSWHVLVPGVLITILVAEVIAGLEPPRGGSAPAASPRRRRTVDVAPRHGLAQFGVVVVVHVVAAVVALARLRDPGAPAATDAESLRVRTADVRDALPFVWGGAVAAAVVVVLVVAAMRLATTRRAVLDEDGDDRLDAALRARSARITLGVGVALVAHLSATAFEGLRAAANYTHGADSIWTRYGGLVGGLIALAGISGWILIANPPWPGLRAVVATATRRAR